MNRKLLGCVLFSFVSVQALSQTTIVEQSRQTTNYNVLKNGVSQFDYIYTTPPGKPGLNGNPYLDESWHSGTITLASTHATAPLPVSEFRYDMVADRFEIKTENDIRAINGSRIQAFTFKNTATGQDDMFQKMSLPDGKVLETDFAQIMATGKVFLLKRKYAIILEPTYNTALMVGDKDRKITMREAFYLQVPAPYALMEARRKKDIWSFFASLGFDAEAYARQNALDVTSEAGILAVVKAFNLEHP